MSDFSPCSKFENAKSDGKAEPMCINAGNPEELASSKRENKCLLNFQPRYIPAILLLFSERLFSGSKMFLTKFFYCINANVLESYLTIGWKLHWQRSFMCGTCGGSISRVSFLENKFATSLSSPHNNKSLLGNWILPNSKWGNHKNKKTG